MRFSDNPAKVGAFRVTMKGGRPRFLSALLMSVPALGWGQERTFPEEAGRWWLPALELEVRDDRNTFSDGRADLVRQDARLRLRWSLGAPEGWWSLDAGTAHRIGSDGNRFNAIRQDNEPSNGANLDLAQLRLRGYRPLGGADGAFGLVENGLIHAESLWDPDLRLQGASARVFLRTEEGLVEEAGIRLAAGEVRLMQGGRVKLRAIQGVLRLQTGSLAWTLAAGPWRLHARQEDAPLFRRQNPANPGNEYGPPGSYRDPDFNFMVLSAGCRLEWMLPIELKAIRHRNQEDGGRGEELQAWVGSRNRAWWPQFGYIRQRLDASGALASVNGDLWWLHANADGQRYVAALGLPARWSLSWSFVEQARRGGSPRYTRSILAVQKRF